MVNLTIDGRSVQVAPGQTLLAAAGRLGIDIPTLCYLEKCGPATSCLVCLVKLEANGQSRMVPACATQAQPGMVVESETDEVHEARRTALELLLSDHVGDCFSPCHRICPLHLDIPVMIRQIQSAQLAEAAATVRSALPLAAVLGRLCHHPCENGCRRGTWDQPAAIREMERAVADESLKPGQGWLPPRAPSTGKSVAVVGAGPAGLAAAWALLQSGHHCTVVDRHEGLGGSLRASVEDQTLPPAILEAEIAQLRRMGIHFKPKVELRKDVTLEGLLRGFDAVLLALGEVTSEEVKALGLAATPTGIKINPVTFQSSVANVFAVGSAVKPVKPLVRALSEGRAAAAAVHQFLSGKQIAPAAKPFSSVMGRLEQGEIELFLNGPSPGPRTAPSCGTCGGFTCQEAAAEASRCLHCDCRSVGNCQLQNYAERYGADPGRFRQQRRPFEQHLQHGEIIFEPGKCILCGLCVQLAEQAREPLGLTFIGRGFEVRVATPFNRTIAEGLQKVAAECVRECPTGALVFRDAVAAPQPRNDTQ